MDTLEAFREDKKCECESAVRKGLSLRLVQQKRVRQLISQQDYGLPEIYEEYLNYYAKSRQVHDRHVKGIRRVLSAFHNYLHKSKLDLSDIGTKQIDAFWAEFVSGFAFSTCKSYRSYLQGFLGYLYYERRILKKNISLQAVGSRTITPTTPPLFLRPHELKRLFVGMDSSRPVGLRTYAVLHLAYTVGLGPCEICSITLDDIHFSQGEMVLRNRNTVNPLKLPLSEYTIKAIAAYIIGARPQSNSRAVFLKQKAPYGPISPSNASGDISRCMFKANLGCSAYSLRHTYAQNLLERGASIFEVNQMLGHRTVQTTKRYLQTNTKLVRKVLFDETL